MTPTATSPQFGGFVFNNTTGNLEGTIGNAPGGFSAPAAPSSAQWTATNGPANSAIQQSQSNLDAGTQALIQAQNALLREQATPAPVLNYQGILSQAQAQQANPNSAVNQLYQSQLNNYLQNEAAQQQQAQQQQQLSIKTAQQQLQNTQAQLGQQQQYTGQQTGLQLGNIGVQQQQYQKQQGVTGEQNLASLRAQQGQSGLAGSGLAAGQEFQQNLARQISEGAQENQYQYQRNSALLNEQNTFAQIAQQGKYAQQAEAGQEGQANINLNKFLQQAAYSEQSARAQLSQWQQTAQMAAAQNAAAQQVSQFIQSYRNNPLLYSKAMQAYSPLAQGVAQPQLPNLPGA